MNLRKAVVPLVCLLAVAGASFAQNRVDPINMYERVLAIVPVVGQGTAADPYRPKYAPLKSEIDLQGLTGVMAFTSVLSDDRKFALIELVTRNRAVLKAVLEDANVKAYLKGRDKREDAEAEFKKLKKDFSIDRFGVIVP